MSVYVWILPAVIAAAWILSWWGQRWIRWTLLPAGAVVSVLFVVTGFHLPVPPLSPDSGCTREQVQCMKFASGLLAGDRADRLRLLRRVAGRDDRGRNRDPVRNPGFRELTTAPVTPGDFHHFSGPDIPPPPADPGPPPAAVGL